jgi:hypothetical protein
MKLLIATNFVFVQLIAQEPGIYDKRHPHYARRDKIDLAWERISHEVKEPGMCVYVYCISKYRMCAKAMRTTTKLLPVLCDTSQQLG